MDLNNLDLPEPAKAQLRQKLEKLHRDYETDLENLTDDATDAMESAKPLEGTTLTPGTCGRNTPASKCRPTSHLLATNMKCYTVR